MKPRSGNYYGNKQIARDWIGLGILPLCFDQHRSEQVIHERQGDIDGHQTHQKVIGLKLRFQKSDDPRPQASRDHGRCKNQQKRQDSGQRLAQRKRHGHRGHGTHIKLALGADIVQVRLVREGERKRGKDQRGCLYKNLRKGVPIADQKREEFSVYQNGICSQEEHHQAACRKAEQYGNNRGRNQVSHFRIHCHSPRSRCRPSGDRSFEP